MNYLDSSALIKLFVEERGSGWLARLVEENGAVATAKIAYAEIYAGLARKHRAGGLSGPEYARTCHRFEDEWRAYLRLDVADDVLVLARDMIQRHPLRGFDAIHLACAISLQTLVGERVRLVAADARLLQAAEAERLVALNPETAASA